jgi:hypothetical protein
MTNQTNYNMYIKLTHFSVKILELISQSIQENIIELKFDYPEFSDNTLKFPIMFESKILDKSEKRYFHCQTISGFNIQSDKIKDPKSFFTNEIINALTELAFASYHQHITTHMIYVAEYKTFDIPHYKSMFEINTWVKNAIAQLN